MKYNRTNNLLGWVCFGIAAITYILTLEPSGSFWDCGEFISAAYKLQVVHQPGAPLFLMIQKIFSLFAAGNVHKIAWWMNFGSAICSGLTILFLFWTITALAKKVIWKAGETPTVTQLILIMGSGAVGALAYTFSDSFWFSAVESEVYAMSSLCTAIVFWAILKWDAHADEPKADRWLLFIAYVMGLSIGVHLLNLLAIPAMAIIYYFRRTPKPTSGGTIAALLIGCVILGVIQYGVIQYLIKFAAYFDLFFVNTLGLGFGSGVIFFALLLIGLLFYGVQYSIRKAKPALNLAMVGLVFILIGYSSFAMIVIRAKANTSLNNSDPENVFALLSYLNREQYGDRPLLYGQYFDSKRESYNEGGNIYRKGKDKYEVAGKKFDIVYDRNTLLPRMYSDDGGHPGFYREWMQMSQDESPTMLTNLGFLFSYQTGFMYARYFLWNFSGRQNDEQGDGNNRDGNWITGIKPIDHVRLGSTDGPNIVDNEGYNRFFMLPLIIGLIGAFWHFKRNQKDAGAVGLLFFMTGMAIVLYLNQTPLQPRERDYAYTGSFYAFTIWIGLGVAGIAEMFRKMNPKTAAVIATAICLLGAPVIMAQQGWDDHDRSTKYTPRDFATDYLESCAPNAILFTYGDNDTYPLWYAQEVEGIRPDVRIVNLSLLGTDWYIRQLKSPVNKAAGLPITMGDEKFIQGVRDMIPFNPEGFDQNANVNLGQLFDLLMSENPADKVTYQDGSKENFFPTKKWSLPINAGDVIATNTVPASMKDSLLTSLDWTFSKNFIGKQDLAMLDILAHNNWKRPIYFAVTVPRDNFNGLDKYLYNEGLAYRLLPLKVNPADSTSRGEEDDKVNADAMYTNMMNKFAWGNMKNARYLDPESTRMIGIFIKSFNQLATQLLQEGKKEEARKVMLKELEVVPERNYSVYFPLHKFYSSDLLYQLDETQKANALVKANTDYLTRQLNYLFALGNPNLNGDQIQLSMSIYNEFLKLTAKYKQAGLNKQLDATFKGFESRFMGMSGGGQQ